MQFSEYQRSTRGTDQRPGHDLQDIAVHLLGLAGEAGSVASEYKKWLRDGESHAFWKAHMREELGDVLWYVAALADHLELDLDEIAKANLQKTQSRWLEGPTEALDETYPDGERLPRVGAYEFVPTSTSTGRPAVAIVVDGQKAGSILTDASTLDDGYRYHDVFHLAFAVLLGWSPVTRAILDRKRRSDPNVDENQDGGRAVVIEEGIAALAFGYAAQHHMLEGVTRLDQKLLDTIEMMAASTEAGLRTQADWERAILAGFAVFRQLREAGGGTVTFDADQRTMAFSPEWTPRPDLTPTPEH